MLFELERRDAVSQQAADFRVSIIDNRTDAVEGQDVGCGKTGRARAYNTHALARGLDVRHVGPPTLLDRLVRNVAFDITDADGADAVVERACALAEAILRTDAAANLRQRIGLVGKIGRLEQPAFLDQGQPVRDVIVNRAFPFAVGIAARDTAAGLSCGARTVVRAIDLAEVRDALFGRFLLRVAARDLEELQRVLRHHAARRSDSIREPSAAAFGLISQNFGRNVR